MNSDFSVAVHAMVYLSHSGCTLSSEALAQNICTNPARVRKVMSKLAKAGCISTKEGLEGGYQLARPAAEITLAQVSRALEVKFVNTGWKSGDPAKACLIASGMADVLDSLYAHLDEICKQRLAEITVGTIEERIFAVHPGGIPSCAPQPK